MPALLRPALNMMHRVAVNRDGFRILDILDVRIGKLGPVHFDRQFVELGGQGERRQVIRIVHAGQGVGADVEGLVPLQDHGQRVRHGFGGHDLAVHLQHAGAGPAEAAHVVERERADAQAVILEVELHGVLAGRERIGAFPFDAFQVDQVPEEHRLAFEQVEAVAGKPPAGGQDHAFGAALGDSRCPP